MVGFRGKIDTGTDAETHTHTHTHKLDELKWLINHITEEHLEAHTYSIVG